MRNIKKTNEPQELRNFIKKNRPTNWECIHSSVSQSVYDACREKLYEEQKTMSGYTERIMKLEDTRVVHIDHFKKRDLFPELTFDWDNLILDEHICGYGADYKDIHVKREDYQFLINPIYEDPHEYLTYQIDGKMIPQKGLSENKKRKAETTIRIFNLNSPKLVNQRNSRLNQIADCIDEMSPEDIFSIFKKHGLWSVTEFALGLY